MLFLFSGVRTDGYDHVFCRVHACTIIVRGVLAPKSELCRIGFKRFRGVGVGIGVGVNVGVSGNVGG